MQRKDDETAPSGAQWPWQPYADEVAAIDNPPDASDMQAPVTQSGTTTTDEDVAAASLILSRIEYQMMAADEVVRAIIEASQAMAEAFQDGHGYPPFYRAQQAANAKRDAWLDYQKLLTVQYGVWSAALGKMEHNLEWQAYASQNLGWSPDDGRVKAFNVRAFKALTLKLMAAQNQALKSALARMSEAA
ncbi:MAG: hypothetical protein ABL904_17150 [Hyphomicrobiaceae bacterium]